MVRKNRLESELVVSLTDHASRPAGAIEQNLRRMEQNVQRQKQAMDVARGRMFDAAAMGYVAYRAFSEPITAAIEFQAQLESIRQKAEVTREELAALGEEARAIGLATSQGAGKITGALDTLLGSGAVSKDQAQLIATPLGEAASAYSASTDDLAEAAASLVDNLNIPAEEISLAYDMMAEGGKEGKFELRDMAAEFPGITAAAKALGIEGTAGLADLVALLQVATTGAASGSEAANNMVNFMRKVMAPDAIKKFGEAGVDIVAEMNAAIEAGASPMERALEIIGELTEGGKQDLLGGLFADAQVQAFLLPLLQGMEEYRRIREEAMAAEGTVHGDYQEWLTTPGGSIARFEASVENLNIAVGSSLLPKLTEFVNAITPMVDGVARFVDANDQLVGAILEMVAAIVALRVAAAALGFAGSFLGMGKGGGGGLGLTGVGGGNGRGGAPGAGANGTGAKSGPNLGGWGFLGFNAIGIGSDVAAFGEAVNQDGGKAWLAERDARDKAINDLLLNADFWGVKPFQTMQGVSDAFNRPEEDGGIGGGYTGATQGQIDALKVEIAELDAEIAEWPEEGMEARRAALSEKLTAMEAELAASGSAISAEFAALIARMRAAAAAGVTIPINTSGPALPQAGAPDRTLQGFSRGGWVSGAGTGTSDDIPAYLSNGEFVVNADAAGRFGGLLEAVNAGYPAGDLLASAAGGFGRMSGSPGAGGSVSISVGNIMLQNPVGASPAEIAAAFGRELEDRISGLQADMEWGVA